MNGRRRFLYASVISIHDSSFLYPACQNCFSRLVQVSQKYNCHRCSTSCDTKDVHYRYKLSLGVADDCQLFKITVFGSCLDEHFGLSADALQRYIQDLTQASDEHERETAQNLLLKATEFCFVGRNFIFGVKSSENKADQLSFSCNSFLTTNRHEKDLVACQISVPKVDDVGCTVINFYSRLLQSSAFKSCQSSSPATESIGTGVSQASNEQSSLYQSYKKQAHPRSSRCLLNPWQLSFGFTSSSVNSSSSAEFSAGNLSNAIIDHSGQTKTPVAGLNFPDSQTQPIPHPQCSGSFTGWCKERKQGKQMDYDFTFTVSQTDTASASSNPMQITNTLSSTLASIAVGSYDSNVSSPSQSTPYWENACFKTNGISGSDGYFESTLSKFGSSSWVTGQVYPNQYLKGFRAVGYEEKHQEDSSKGEHNGDIDSGNQGPNYDELHKIVNYEDPQGPKWNKRQGISSDEEDTYFRSDGVYSSTSCDEEYQHTSSGEEQNSACGGREHRGVRSNNEIQKACSDVAHPKSNRFKKYNRDGSSDEGQGAGRSRLCKVASTSEYHQGSNRIEEHLTSGSNEKQKGVGSDEVPQVTNSDEEHHIFQSYVAHRGIRTTEELQSTKSNEERPGVGNNVQPQVTTSSKHRHGARGDEETRDASSDVDEYLRWSTSGAQGEASSNEEYQGNRIEDEHQVARSNEDYQGNSSTAELKGSSSDEHNAVWDDLPFSESLSEFIAKVENGSNSTAEIHFKASSSSSINPSCRSKNVSVDPHSGCSGGRLQLQQAKTNRRSKRRSSASSVKGQVVQNSVVSKSLLKHREQRRYLDLNLSSRLSAPKRDSVDSSSSQSSSLSTFSIIRPQTVNGKPGKNDKSAEKRAGSLCLPKQLASARSTSVHLEKSSVSVVEGKTDCCGSSKDHHFHSKNRFSLESHHTDATENSDLKFVTDAQETDHDSLPLDSSNTSDQNSYNGSSDLFGSSDKEQDFVLESPRLLKHATASATSMLDKRRVVLQSHNALPHHRWSGTPPSQDQLIAKRYLSSVCSPSDSDQENVGSQDFVPSSQSTPHACSFRGKQSSAKETSAKTQNSFSPIISKRGGSTLLLHSDLRQPATNCFKRQSTQIPHAVKTRTYSYATLHDSAPFTPSAELFESDSEDCIPPSMTKSLQAVPFPKSIIPVSQIRNHSPSCISNSPDAENRRVQKANKYSDNGKQMMTRETPSVVLVHSALPIDCTRAGKSKVCPLYPSSNSPQTSCENANYLSAGSTCLEDSVDDGAGNWSPDLFAEKLIYSQQHGPVQKKLFSNM